MKYLQDYLEGPQSACFQKHGAFFAFSPKQFAEQKKDGVTYCNMGAGLICPKDNAQPLMAELDHIWETAIAQDVAENGTEAIILRELDNHEAWYTWDIESTADALESYEPFGITREEILRVFRENAHRLQD